MAEPVVVLFCMPERGHLQRSLPVIHAIARQTSKIYVYTDRQFADRVTRAGGVFMDLFAEGPLDAIDADSIPVPSRYVTFAACRGQAIAARISRLSPTIIVHDTFAVIARVVAHLLDLPAINLCACHALVPSRAIAAMALDSRVKTSRSCLDAISRLQSEYGMDSASPFSYLDGLSPLLNLYGEPKQYLSPADRSALEPLAFFGSLLPEMHAPARVQLFDHSSRKQRIYVSFGSVVWRYFAPKAESLLRCLAAELNSKEHEVIVSTSGYRLSAATAAELLRSEFHVLSFVDQWSVLQEADVFITHQGLNSSHEAIWHGVPMLSCPFFSDQPPLAKRCHALGLALPLCPATEQTIAPGVVRECFSRLQADAERMHDRLSLARQWEIQVMAERDGIVKALLAFA